MIASLPMYDWPEVRAATDIYWQTIRAALKDGPAGLCRDMDDLMGHWQRPDLLLSQTCGMPYRTQLHGHVTLVGTPDYGVAGCAPGHYCSVLIVNAQDGRDEVSDFAKEIFAYNEGGSQSGWSAAATHMGALGLRLTRCLVTGSHRASLRAVADGHAAMAAIDAVTWALAQRHDPACARLRVIAHTAPTPGLPYITAQAHAPAPIAAAITTAIAALDAAPREALMLRGLIQIPASAYLAVPTPDAPQT
jgi:ABC-type phosphate/phosphonate transport system substrate-binding protein